MAKAKEAKAKKAKPKSAGLMTEVAVETLSFAMGRAADIDEVLKQAGVSRQRLSVLMADDEISQAMETRLDAVLNAPWRFVENQGEQTVFLKELFTRWHFEIVSGAWDACPYGYSVLACGFLKIKAPVFFGSNHSIGLVPISANVNRLFSSIL